MAEPKLIKICLTNRGEDTETPWAADLGPAPNAPPHSLKVKLVNVPFMHAKPTWGDTIIVTPASDKVLTWDRDGVPWKEIANRIVEDGGRWAMILDYAPHAGAADAMPALGRACDAAKIVCEGAWGPRESDPGRVYLAVQKELSAEQVMEILTAASLPLGLTQIHPEPKKRPPAMSDTAGRSPAKAARAKPAKPIEAPASDAASTAVMDSMRPGSRDALAAASSDVPAADAKPADPPPAAAKSAKPVVAETDAKPALARLGAAKAAAKAAVAKPAAGPAPTAKSTPAKTATKVIAKPAVKPAKAPAKLAQPAAKKPAAKLAKPPVKKPAKPAATKPAKPAAKQPTKKK